MRQHMIRARWLTHLLDSRFRIGPWRFGLDPLLGLLPGLGDLVSLFVSLYLVWIGWQSKLPASKMFRMIFYILLDLITGTVPVFGDVLDFGFKANEKNMQILTEFLPSAS